MNRSRRRYRTRWIPGAAAAIAGALASGSMLFANLASIEMNLVEPAYRGWVFPERPLVRLQLRGTPGSTLDARVRIESGAVRSDRTRRIELGDDGRGEWTIPVDYVPTGSFALRATAGEAERRFDLRRLTRDEVRGIVAYVDRRGRLVWRGRPIYVRGWYSDGNLERLRRIGASKFNAVLDYGLTSRPIAATKEYLAEAERLGVAVILCVNDVYPSATYRERLGDWEGNDEILAGVVRAFRNSPAAVAWYNNDELEFDLAGEAREYYDRIRALDPSRPQLMVHFKRGGIAAFRGAADLFGIDHYPVPKKPLVAVAEALDAARGEVAPPGRPWAVIQNFAWYQHRDPETPVIAGDVETPRSRLPTAKEWRENRPPTFEEVRAMTYLAVVHGAGGILFWSLYNLEFLPDRVERWENACRVAAELSELEPILLSPDARSVECSNPEVHVTARMYEGATYVIAINASDEPLRATLRVAGARDGRVNVVFERRTVLVDDESWTDFFAPYGRHVYRVE